MGAIVLQQSLTHYHRCIWPSLIMPHSFFLFMLFQIIFAYVFNIHLRIRRNIFQTINHTKYNVCFRNIICKFTEIGFNFNLIKKKYIMWLSEKSCNLSHLMLLREGRKMFIIHQKFYVAEWPFHFHLSPSSSSS